MKFIKDIIGEKREHGPLSAEGGAAPSGSAAPEREMLTSILSEARGAQASATPLKLDAASRVDETPAANVDAPTRPTPSVKPVASSSDALDAFLKARSQALAEVQADAPQPTRTAPLPARADDLTEHHDEDARDTSLAPSQDLAAPDADDVEPDGLERPYRIFTRRNRTKMLQLEAEAAAQDPDHKVGLDAGDADDADEMSDVDVPLIDEGPDEFVHVRQPDTREGQTEPEVAQATHAPQPDTRANALADDVAQLVSAQSAPNSVHPVPSAVRDVNIVTSSAPRAPQKPETDRASDHLPADDKPELNATFPEPAFADAAAAAGVDLGAPDLGVSDLGAGETGRAMGRAGRVKTRLLGFDAEVGAGDPFAQSGASPDVGTSQFPVGWLVVVDGPGRGAGFTLFAGVTVIGRGEGQTIRLDFGDSSISRDQHAAIAYDPEQRGFFIGHGGKANLVRRNGRPVLSTETLAAGDLIRVGETTLRFVPLCGADFSWQENDPQADAATGAHFA